MHAGSSERFYYWDTFGDAMYETPDNGTTFNLVGDNKQVGEDIGSYAVDPTGQYILGPWDTGQRGKSSDFGTTFSGLPNLPFGGLYRFAYAGGVGINSRWIAARGVVRYSPDAFGAETWYNKEGNLGFLIPINMNIIKIIVPGLTNGN